MSSRREYEMMFKLNAQLGSNYNATFVKAQAQVAAMQKEIVDLGKTQSNISDYQKQQSAIEATRKKLETLQQQYENIQREISETEGYSSSLENQLLSKKQAIEKTTAALELQTQKAQQTGAALEESGIDVNNLAQETDRLTSEIQALKNEQQGVADGAEAMGISGASAVQAYHEALIGSGILDALKEIYEGLMDCANASIAYESAITGVYKTVDGTEEELAAISDEIKQMATEIPATTDEIAGVAEAAGQLGIATGSVMDFTRVMIDLGESTNLTADEAATALAKFSNITGTAASDYSRLGSVIVDLGNNYATTEADIVAMSTRLASAGTLAGLTEAEIMALAAAMSSVGIEAEAGGTAMTQTLSSIESAVVNGGEELDEFARISGMSAYEFAQYWESAPIEAIQAFIAGLGSLDQKGESAVLVLDELGLSGVRQSNMLKSLGLAAETLSGAIGTANTAWNENVALSIEASKRYATTESQQAMLQNAFNNLKIAIGDNYNPVLKELYGLGTDVMNGITQFVQDNPRLVKALTAAVGVIGLVTAGVVAYSVAAKAAAAASAMLSAAIPGLNVIMAVTAVVAGLTAAFMALKPEVDEETKAMREMTAASREEYLELKALKAEYENLCETSQETTDEALRLRYQIDVLSESFEANRQTIEEFAAECQEVVDAHTEMADRFDENQRVIDDNEIATLALIQQLSDLADGTYKTANSQMAMQAIIDELNSSMEGLNLTYDDVISNQGGVIQGVKDMAKAEAERARQLEMYNEYVELLKKQSIEEEKIAKATDEVTAAQSRYNEAYAAWEKEMYPSGPAGKSDPLRVALGDTVAELDKAEEDLEVAKKAQTDIQASLDDTKARIKEIEGYWDGTTATTEENEGAMISWQSASEEAFAAVQTEMEELVQEYGEVYTAALDSLEGQFGLFDKASMKSEEYKDATVNNAQKALDSQLAYWESYSENLTFLRGMTAEQLGTTQANYDALISLIQDGSAESAGLAANMVKQIKAGNEDAVAELADTVVKVNAEREEIATATAEWTTGFSEKMGELTQTMEFTVYGLQLDDEAAAAAKATIQAYADAILEEKDSAVEAAEQVANAVAAAFKSTYLSQITDTYNKYAPSAIWPTTEPYEITLQKDIPGYAGGTHYAERGFAYVGENGPELIFFNGGERVLTAAETAAYTHTEATEAKYSFDGGSSTVVEVNIHVEGNATEQTVEALDAYSEEFAERVRSVIAEEQDNIARRRY